MKVLKKIILVGLALAALTAVWGVIDNNRVVVVEETIQIENLPDAFDGYQILQISDLHGKEFGSAQKNLLAKINALDYDLIAVTGDMASSRDANPQPLYDLLDGLDKDTPIFYTAGNSGPWDLDIWTGEITSVGKELQARGVTLLDLPYALEKNGETIWIGELWDTWVVRSFYVDQAVQELKKADLGAEERQKAELQAQYQQKLLDALEQIQPEDTLIAVSHTPYSTDFVGEPRQIEPSYDLVLVGHYHGGQICLPLIGAIYIPDGASTTRGFFPKTIDVKGLRDWKEWGGFQQYISTGLGASDSIPLLGFRLFNPPEINLLTLRKK